MEPLVEYYDADILEIIFPRSEFISKASASPRKCEECCTIVDNYIYFSYDARWKEADHRFYLLVENSTRNVVCSEPVNYANMKEIILGRTSG